MTSVHQPRVTPLVHNVEKRLGQDIITQLIADYEAGHTTTMLTSTYGIGKGTVLCLLRMHGVTLRHQPLTDEQVQQAIQLYQQGNSLAAVAVQLGQDDSLIHLTLKRAASPGVTAMAGNGALPSRRRITLTLFLGLNEK